MNMKRHSPFGERGSSVYALMPLDTLKQLLDVFKETLFPHSCGICRKTGSPLCNSCFLLLGNTLRHSQSCGHCGIRETPSGSLCPECSGHAPHDGLFAALRYDDPRIARLIHLFKYRFIRDLATPLGALLATATLRAELAIPDAIIPVPLHPRRERSRGWNQSALLANAFITHFPVTLMPPILDTLLVRTRYTATQMSIRDRTLREKNTEGAFRILEHAPDTPPSFDIGGKRLWLIDDVAASGSTIAACARTLKEHGAHEVFGIVIAR